MKLTDLYDMDGFHHDVNARAPAFVRDHLVSAGLEELASIDFWDDDVRRFFVATDAGLYIGVFTRVVISALNPSLRGTVWSGLPTQQLGAVYDEAQIADQIARHVGLAANLALVVTEDAAIGIGIGPIDMLGRVTGPNSMTFPFTGSGRGSVRLEPAEAYSTTSLARIAPEIGAELAARLTMRLEQRSS